MALSIESKSFHDIKNHINSLSEVGQKITPDVIRSVVDNYGENMEDFKRAYKNFESDYNEGRRDFRSGSYFIPRKDQPPLEGGYDVDPGRIAGGFAGDMLQFGKSLGEFLLPEQVE